MQTSTRARRASCPQSGLRTAKLALRTSRPSCKPIASTCQRSCIGAWQRHAAQRLAYPTASAAAAAAAAAAASPRRPTRTTTTAAAAASAASSTAAAAADSGNACSGRAVVVGGGPAGLAAAIGLARQAGFRVDVFDARLNPAGDNHSSKEALLVALGARGLQALNDLGISLTPPPSSQQASSSSSRSSSPQPASRSTPPTPGSGSGTILDPASAGSANAGASQQQQQQQQRDLGAASGIATASFAEDASAITGLVGGVKPPSGLTLLQGMLMLGPGSMRRVEKYGRAAAAATPGLAVPAGVAVMDSHTLTTTLLAEACATEHQTPTGRTATATLILPDAAAAGSSSSSRTPLQAAGAAAAGSAEEAQEAMMPAIPKAAAGAADKAGSSSSSSSSSVDLAAATAGVRCHYGCELLMVDTANRQATFIGPDGEALVAPYDILIGAEPGSGSHLVADALAQLQLRKLTHNHPESVAPTSTSRGSATSTDQHQAIYGSLAAAAAAGGAKAAAAAATAIGAAQHDASTRTSATAGHSRAASAAAAAAADAAGFVELEFKSWCDMPHQRELKELLPAGLEALQASLDEVGQHRKHAPGKGWLLVWTGSAGSSAAQPFPTSTNPNTPRPEKATWVVDTPPGGSAAGGASSGANAAAKPAASAATAGGGSGATLMFPGGPSCTLMAWPSRGGGSWSGCVFTAPQVFESLRSQADNEGLLRGLRAAGGSGSALPGLWVKGIAAQLRGRGERVGRVLAPWLPPPPHLAAPSAGLLLLSPAAALTSSPQMLCPAASLGLQDAAVLAAAVAAALPKKRASSSVLVVPGGGGAGGGAGSGELHRQLEQALKQFDRTRQPEVAALQHLQAQLSYLRHPFTPAAPAALAAVPPASLAWLAGFFGKAKAGLALQWRCLAAVLPLIAAVLKAAYSDASKNSSSKQSAGGNRTGAGQGAGASAANAAGLTSVLQAVRPSGASLMAFMHTTGVPYSGVWSLLHWAPLLLGLVWGAVLWAAVQAVRWLVLAYRVWGVSWAGA